jgi:hypothetical protein
VGSNARNPYSARLTSPASTPQVRMLNGDCQLWSAAHPLPGADALYTALEGVGFNDTALSAR